MGGKSKAPAAPDPVKTAAAQTSTNVSTALANAALSNVNQYGPSGSETWATNGGQTIYDPTTKQSYFVPKYEKTTTLAPAQQAIFDQDNRASLNLSTLAADQSGRLNDILSKPFTTAGAPEAGTAGNYQKFGNAPALATSFGDAGQVTKSYGANDFSADRNRMEAALMERQQGYMDRNRESLEAKLANQGIKMGSAAYSAGQYDLNRSENDARLATIAAAGQEQSRLVGMDRDRSVFENAAQQQNYNQLQDRANFANTNTQQNFANGMTTTQANNALASQTFNEKNALRSQSLTEQYAARNQPIQEISGLMNGSQMTMPQFGATNMPTMPTVDYAGLVQQNYQNQLGAWQQQQQSRQGLLGGLMGLGSAAIMASDRRVKENISKVGKVDGHNVYSYRYKSGGPMQLGVMAQEVEKKNPDAVMEIGGVKHVNYGKLFQLGA